jgi:hypothetical protein
VKNKKLKYYFLFYKINNPNTKEIYKMSGDDYTPKSRKEKRKNSSEKKASSFYGGKFTPKGTRLKIERLGGENTTVTAVNK